MVRYSAAAVVAVVLSASSLVGAATNCGEGSPCPADSPCCSQYGFCGVGAYCLGGCDPQYSHSLDSCVPAPVCQSSDYKLDSLDDVQSINEYLGDASKANWVSSGTPVVYNDDSVLLTMAESTVGTLLASSHYVWYGKICATMTSSQGAGVVTAFIMMSDVKDEIDFEFIGVDLETVQSNYYSQGVTVFTNAKNISVSNTRSSTHEYCIDWSPDQLEWLLDGNSMRTVKKADTWNSTANRFDYPQTPSRVMLSLWPAGLPSNGQGTIDWAGGLIDWNSQYMQNGYYYAMVKEVTVDCYDAPSGANVSGSKTYIYNDIAGTNNTVAITDEEVILKSLFATGEDPNKDPNASASGSSKTASASSTATPETVPGEVGVGGQGQANGASSAPGSSSTGSSSSGGGGSSFSQGGDSSKSGAAVVNAKEGGAVGSSVFAVIVAVVGLMVL